MTKGTPQTTAQPAPGNTPVAEQVGYKRPPRKFRFPKGHSGNAKGRPRGRPNIGKIASRLFDAKIPIRIGDETIKLSFIDALIRVHQTKALQGNQRSLRAMRIIMDELGYFDEKIEPEKQGVLVVPDTHYTPEEWLYARAKDHEETQARREKAIAAERSSERSKRSRKGAIIDWSGIGLETK